MRGNMYYDYQNQAWVHDGKYVRCAHPETMNCKCYGKLHEGEKAVCDVTLRNEGTIVMVRPCTDKAKEWFVEHLNHDGVTWYGGAVACEPRYLEVLVRGMIGDGLMVVQG